MISSPHLPLAESVVSEGFAPHEMGVATLVGDARHQGVSKVLLEILADRSAPRVVRERALGRVIVAIENPSALVSEQPLESASCSAQCIVEPLIDVLERACA